MKLDPILFMCQCQTWNCVRYCSNCSASRRQNNQKFSEKVRDS